VLYEPVQAKIVEAICDRRGQHCADAQMKDETAAGPRPHKSLH
jgi:hypothetical protein